MAKRKTKKSKALASKDRADIMSAVEGASYLAHMRDDEWNNVVSGLARAATDARVHGEPGVPRSAHDRVRWENIFHGDPLAARIASLLPEDETREWIQVRVESEKMEGESDERREDPTMDVEERVTIQKAVMDRLEELKIQQAIFTSRTWARTYGGALMLLGAIDGSVDLEKPLDLTKITSFEHVNVFDRFEWTPVKWYADPEKANFGLPETYRMGERNVPGGVRSVSEIDSSQEVHETRFIRFDGPLTSRRRRVKNNGWHDPIFVALFPILRDFAQAWGGVANMLHDFRVAVWKMRGLADALKAGEHDAVLDRFRIMNLCVSIAQAVPLDAENEDYEKKSTNLSGLPETLDRFAEQVSAATGYPITLLFGKSAAGLSATGDNDIRQYYDKVAASQRIHLKGPLTRIIELIFLDPQGPTKGKIPDKWTLKFNPLWQLDDLQEAQRRGAMAKADKLMIDAGVLTAEEVALSRWGGDEYSVETTLDLEAREKAKEEEEANGGVEAEREEMRFVAEMAAAAAANNGVPPVPGNTGHLEENEDHDDVIAPISGSNEPIDQQHSDPKGGQTGGEIILEGEQEGMHVHKRPDGRGRTEPAETGTEHVHTTSDGNTGPSFPRFREDQRKTPSFCKLSSPNYNAARCKRWRAAQRRDEDRADRIKKVGSKYQVTNRSGTKVLGTHKTRKGAEAQLAAVEASKNRRDNFRRRGPRDWVVVSNEGAVIGRHTTRASAQSQIGHILESQGIIVERLSATEWIVVNAEGDIVGVHTTRTGAAGQVDEILGRTDSVDDPHVAPNTKPIAYYAHPIETYGSDGEAADIAHIKSLGYEVINPNDPALADVDGMDPFLELVRGSDVVFKRGETSGVNYEVHEAEKHRIPVEELEA